MNNIKVIGIILFVSLITSCKNKEKTVVNNESSEKPELHKEVTNSAIEAFIEKMINEEHFKGVVLVTKKNEVIHAKGYGMANDTLKNNLNTKFHVASITKQFTAAAIMQLVEKNKIKLEESINKFLPVQYRSDKWDIVTVHHLLSHTSGIEDYAVTRDYYNVVKGFCLGNTVDGMIKEAMPKELEFSPGSKFIYSNIGYTLLGEIIQNITGEPYRHYLKTNVLEPLEMHSSFIHTTDYEASNDEAIGYRWDDEQHKHVLDDIVSLPVTEPDGNLVTTLNDFLKWTNIYNENEQSILQKESLKKMMTSYVETDQTGPDGNLDGYGYGLFLSKDLISHTGYIVGFRSHFIMNPKENIRVVVFSNNVSMSPKDVSNGVYKIISDKKSDKRE
ncbi:serine hydrolase domain-containing protein [Arenibacter palladensis]|uniref:serine hydrolase domain-containing protein n=1 Tax=Arenibacter palladensis TaxID=237373 RepID=UPI0026E1EEFB|nr:serine hydrolase domain-containing protein [Arenibacter palladensis]MDO6602497.1 serine hydrolase domain-containing protein [Arenibacter palladensis]